jgi:hypothetical protein
MFVARRLFDDAILGAVCLLKIGSDMPEDSPVGWAQWITGGSDGSRVLASFDGDGYDVSFYFKQGKYIGPDIYGVEPVYQASDVLCSI